MSNDTSLTTNIALQAESDTATTTSEVASFPVKHESISRIAALSIIGVLLEVNRRSSSNCNFWCRSDNW
jgi:hypothetical protein